MEQSLIAALFSPHTLVEFRDQVFGQRVTFGRVPVHAMRELAALEDAVARIASQSVGTIKACRMDAAAGWCERVIHAAEASRALARAETVCCKHADAWALELQRWCRRIASELGLADELVYANLYVSPAQTGVTQHFDCTDTIVVQIAGRKTWLIDDAPAVAWPEHNLVIDDAPPVFAYLDRSRFSVPLTTYRRTLQPGDVLTVPRGVCHATLAEDGISVSATFTLAVPSRRQVLESVLRELLLGDPRWRKPLSPHRIGESDSRELVELTRELAGLLASGQLANALESIAQGEFGARVRPEELAALSSVHRCSDSAADPSSAQPTKPA